MSWRTGNPNTTRTNLIGILSLNDWMIFLIKDREKSMIWRATQDAKWMDYNNNSERWRRNIRNWSLSITSSFRRMNDWIICWGIETLSWRSLRTITSWNVRKWTTGRINSMLSKLNSIRWSHNLRRRLTIWTTSYSRGTEIWMIGRRNMLNWKVISTIWEVSQPHLRTRLTN